MLPVSLPTVSKKLQQKQQRRLAEEARKARLRKTHRRANLVTFGIAALVIIAVVAGVFFTRQGQTGGGSSNVGVAAAAANCTDIESSKSEGNQHVDVGTQVDYGTNPPTTGNHWPPDQIADPGFYTDPLEPERLVHNQEHGQVIIWYRPDAPEDVIDQVRQIVEQRPAVNIAVPWDDIESPYNLSLTAWSGDGNEGNVMSCEQVSQQVWDDFRAQFQGRGPEPVGIPTFTKPKD